MDSVIPVDPFQLVAGKIQLVVGKMYYDKDSNACEERVFCLTFVTLPMITKVEQHRYFDHANKNTFCIAGSRSEHSRKTVMACRVVQEKLYVPSCSQR